MEESEKGGRWAKLAFYKECSKCAQEVLVVTEVEDISCQDPKGNPVKMLEYQLGRSRKQTNKQETHQTNLGYYRS